MSKYEGPIVTEGDFNKSTKSRLPICFCLDVSGSMLMNMGNNNTRMDELNRAFEQFIQKMKENEVTAQAADIAVITFGGKVSIAKPFAPLEKQQFSAIEVNERSYTPMGEAVLTSLKLLEARKQAYRSRGIKYMQPWLVIITDGEPEGPDSKENFEQAVKQLNEAEKADKIVVFNVAIGKDCFFDNLKKLSTVNNEPIYINDSTDLDKFFKYIKQSSQGAIEGKLSAADIRNGQSLPEGKKMSKSNIAQFLKKEND